MERLVPKYDSLRIPLSSVPSIARAVGHCPRMVLLLVPGSIAVDPSTRFTTLGTLHARRPHHDRERGCSTIRICLDTTNGYKSYPTTSFVLGFNTQECQYAMLEEEASDMNEAWKSESSDARYHRRLKMSQQQKDAGYQTNYDRDIPMVEGLEDFDYCGSHLDVEACFQARVWRLQQQQQKVIEAKLDHPAAGEETMSTVVYAQVWPNMDQFIFTVSWSGQNGDRAIMLKRLCCWVSKILRQMRPDIEFLTRFKEEKTPIVYVFPGGMQVAH